ncbi:MAG: GNAT family N-acetyltransferase [Erythrobacter sp.]
MTEKLARPIHSLLTGPQAHLAQRSGAAVRIDPRYGPFAAADDAGDVAQADLAAIVREASGEVWLVEGEEWPAPPGTTRVRTAPLVQMMAQREGAPPEPDPAIVPLGDADVPAMTDIVLATEPGPWRELTHLYGQFYGVRDGDKLAAMAGERMRPATGFAEVSGVCTWPEYRGGGMARRLIKHVMQAQRARGEVPFLHSYAHNSGAIGLYERLGFRHVRNMVVTVLRAA